MLLARRLALRTGPARSVRIGRQRQRRWPVGQKQVMSSVQRRVEDELTTARQTLLHRIQKQPPPRQLRLRAKRALTLREPRRAALREGPCSGFC